MGAHSARKGDNRLPTLALEDFLDRHLTSSVERGVIPLQVLCGATPMLGCQSSNSHL